MTEQEALAELRQIVKKADGFSYMCPVCLCGIKTPQEKTEHLESVHGYETLSVE